MTQLHESREMADIYFEDHVKHNKNAVERLLHSGILRHVVCYKFTDFSEELTASIFSAKEAKQVTNKQQADFLGLFFDP
jgi:hypothetical protein